MRMQKIIIALLYLIFSPMPLGYANEFPIEYQAPQMHEVTFYGGVSFSDFIPKSSFTDSRVICFDDGFLFGVYRKEDDTYIGLTENSPITFLNLDLSEKWELRDKRFENCVLTDAQEHHDAVYLFGYYVDTELESTIMRNISTVIKVNRDGKIAWQHLGDPNDRILDYTVNDDGTLACVGFHFTEVDRSCEAFLTQLNPSGDLIKRMEYGYLDLNELGNILTHNNGYIMVGYTKNMSSLVLYVNSNGMPYAYFSILDSGYTHLTKTSENEILLRHTISTEENAGTMLNSKRIEYTILK